MLVLSRKCNQEIIVNGNIRIQIIGISGNTVRLGIEAPKDIGILRGELVQMDEAKNPSTVVSEVPELKFSVDFTADMQ